MGFLNIRSNLYKRLRKFVTSSSGRRLSAWLYSSYFGFVYRTTRWTYLGYEEHIQSLKEGKPFIIVNWHGRLTMMPYAWDWKTWQLTILSDGHPTAVAFTESLRKLGIEVLALRKGSDNIAVLRKAVRTFRKGHCIGITPDGPKGPNRVMKPLALELAAICGAKIAPVSFSVKRRIVLKTWDEFVLPFPFNRGVFIMGPAHSVTKKPSPKTLQVELDRLEAALTGLGIEADALTGHGSRTQQAGT